jgi:prepilin-type N-terminal cleavage/methylation domain-containing protein
MRREDGFTLIEILTAMSLAAILLTLSAYGLRQFWLVRSLEGGTDGVVTQLRQLQSLVTSESNPIVFGAHFDVGTANWTLVRYDPRPAAAADRCRVTGSRRFDAGVVLSSALFTVDTAVSSACVPKVSGATAAEMVFFYARGSATAGSVTLTHPGLGRERTVTISPITGRVTRS